MSTVATRPAAGEANGVNWNRYHKVLRTLVGDGIHRSRLDWWGPLTAALLGGLLRIINLGTPSTLVFDEAYYVRQAYSMVLHGVELRIDPGLANSAASFENGTPNVFVTDGDLVVHPPLGKWLIAVSQELFGVQNAWAWRVPSVIAGIVAILVLGRVTRRLTGSPILGTFAAGLLALEGGHFTHSRTGVLDIFLSTFVLCAFACLLLDRDRSRERLAWLVAQGADLRRYGPRLGRRWWRIGAGVLMGLAVSTKWSGAVFLAVFGLMTVLWDANARRLVGVRKWFVGALLNDAPPAFLNLVGSSAALYVVSWSGWFASPLGYDRHWAEEHPATGLFGLVPDVIRSWVKYHGDIWELATRLDTPHPYKTPAWTWFLQLRPTLFYKIEYPAGKDGCPAGVGSCVSTVNSIGSLAVWWTGLLALVVLLVLWVGWRAQGAGVRGAFPLDWRIGAALSGIIAGYLPWWFSGDRTIYAFYTVAFVPFVIMSIMVALTLVAERGPDLARITRIVAGVLLGFAAIQFALLYPLYTGGLLTKAEWLARCWLPGWH